MLIKEYRICLPLSVEEYRIAQLYMIQKKSLCESSGSDSGVEILINEPYTDGPGGCGQYTHKIYHIGSHLPGWFRAILPKSALIVEEEAWNAYPYTKTIYRCPFIEKFILEIETVYHNDGGNQENVFNLPPADLRERSIDYLDIVKDPISAGDYHREEDPRLFVSQKTGRGPLSENWRDEYIRATSNSSRSPTSKNVSIMCAYKLCRVEFRYWGMQSKIERFIHDVGLRKTMLRAHRQAWCWQDEYYGLTMEDIRRLEHETQLALKEKMGHLEEESAAPVENGVRETPSLDRSSRAIDTDPVSSHVVAGDAMDSGTSSVPHRIASAASVSSGESHRRLSYISCRSRVTGSSRNLSEYPIGGIEKLQNSSSDDDDDDEEYFDAHDDEGIQFDADGHEKDRMYPTSSIELLLNLDESLDSDTGGSLTPTQTAEDDPHPTPLLRRLHQYQLQCQGAEESLPCPAGLSSKAYSGSSGGGVLFILLHGGSILDTGQDPLVSKNADVSTLLSTFKQVSTARYPAASDQIFIRLVECPAICLEALTLLISLYPGGFDSISPTVDNAVAMKENFPLGALALFATNSPQYQNILTLVVKKANAVYGEFLKSEGQKFSGTVCLLADSIGAILGYDILCKTSFYDAQQEADSEAANLLKPEAALEYSRQVSLSNPSLMVPEARYTAESNGKDAQDKALRNYERHSSCPSSRRTSSTVGPGETGCFDFDVGEFFMLGSPLGLVLAYRKILAADNLSYQLPRPQCNQMYNLFYSSDPTAVRLEPLLNDRFKFIPPMKLPRYSRFPLGDGISILTVETLQSNLALFANSASCLLSQGNQCSSQDDGCGKVYSRSSVSSQSSDQVDFTTASLTSVYSRWWGTKRLDYSIFCPDALQNFPATALPYLLHASFWESTDVIAFILRQVVRQEFAVLDPATSAGSGCTFLRDQPREKWLKRRTTIKVKNVAPNHRANDVIVLEGKPQVLSARFMYGPLDVVSLSGERVDVYIMTQPPSGSWVLFGTEVTDANARATYQIPNDKRLPEGIYPVKMVVRGDHTSVDFCLTIVPPKSEAAVFSIDGSFTASVSIMGRDPKVRAGAVDVVRHWHELGYLILYVTARPDMQQRRVVSWLAEHNFPHGMVVFMDGLSTDPLRQKANYLKQLVQEAQISILAAYGSSKDIAVYQAIGLQPDQIFIVGKVAKKSRREAVVIADGYATHLSELKARAFKPAALSARLSFRKGCFALVNSSGIGKDPVRKTTSLPQRLTFREQTLPGPGPTIAVSEAESAQ